MADKNQLKILKQGIRDWNQWREDNRSISIDLREANLSGADLSLANLGLANLNHANLSRANLSRAYLQGAYFTETDLSGTNLSGADFSMAQLLGANLSKADLSGAQLLGANLSTADLSGANLTASEFGLTIFAAVDLSGSLGLETIAHAAPSTVGPDTMRKSKGKIPIAFLRGCGLSDSDIEYAKLTAPGLDLEQVTQITYEIYRLYCDQPIQFYSCFISYSSRDHEFAQRLHDDLQNNGVRCWFAPEDLKIGDEFRKTIGQQVRLRDKLLIILSKNSVQSEWVGDEVEKALAEEKEQGTLKLSPIRLDSAVLKARDDWAEKIRLRRHIGDFSAWKDDSQYKAAFERLLKNLKLQ